MENQPQNSLNPVPPNTPVQSSVEGSAPLASSSPIPPSNQSPESVALPAATSLEDAIVNDPAVGSQDPTETASSTVTTVPAQRLRQRIGLKPLLAIVLIALLLVALIVGGLLYVNSRRSSRLTTASQTVSEQEVQIDGAQTDTLAVLAATATNNRLIVNGDIVAQGSVGIVANGQTASLTAPNLTANQQYALPNASGTICLDTNNCNFALTSQSITNINSQTGTLTIQGTANQITVATGQGTVTLTTPQDIAFSSAPTFAGLTLTGLATQNGNTLCDSSNNCASASVTDAFIQGGNSFGELATLGTNDAFGLALETAGITRMSIDAGGDIAMTGNLDVTGHVTLGANATPGLSSLDGNTHNSVLIVDEAVTNFTADYISGQSTFLNVAPGADYGGWASGTRTVIHGGGSQIISVMTGQILEVQSLDATNYSILAGSIAGVEHASSGSVNQLIGSRLLTSLSNGSTTGADDAVRGIENIVSTALGTNAGLVVGMQTTVDVEGTAEALIGHLITMSGSSVSEVATGLFIDDISATGATDVIGISVGQQTGGSISNIGIRVAGSSTAALWLGADGSYITPGGGIVFGENLDTNLYRSAVDTLRTDDSLYVQGNITSPGSGANSEKFGFGAVATATDVLALGNGASASSQHGIAIGRSATSGANDTIALGYQANGSVGGASIVIGSGASNTGFKGTVIGYQAAGTGTNTTIVGADATGGDYAATLGHNTLANTSSIALGASANAGSTASIAIGRQATTTASNQMVIGSASYGITSVYIGNGVTANTPSAVTLNASGGAVAGTAGAAISILGGAGTTTGTGSNGGAATIRGGTAAGSSARTGGAVTIQGGTPSATGVGGAVSILSGAGGTTSGNSGALTIATGNTTSGTAGSVSIDVGTSTSSAGSILIGTAGRTQTIAIGNSTDATAVGVSCGTGTCGFGNNATDHTTIVGSTTGNSLTEVRGGGAGILIGGGGISNVIRIGNTTGAVTQYINIGTNATVGSSTEVTVGSVVGNSNLTLNSGTGAINIGTSVAKNIIIGNNTGATDVNIVMGSGVLNVTNTNADNTPVAQFQNGGGTICSVTPGVTGFACVSDARLKTNVVDLGDPMDVVRQLRGVSFNWISNPGGQAQVGFIAQELERLIPSAVSTLPEGYKVANYEAIIPYLVGAAQAQDTHIVGLLEAQSSDQVGLSNAQAKLSNLEQRLALLERAQGQSSTQLASLNVSGGTTLQQLTVVGSTTTAQLTVTGNARFAGDITLEGHVLGNSDTRGAVTVKANETSATITFTKAYQSGSKPNVVLTAQDGFAPPYRVEATHTGFTVFFQTTKSSDITLNYQVQQ